MNEMTKTLLFVVAGVGAVAAAIMGTPGRVGVEAPDMVGQPLFADFEDPSAAESLEVREYDELSGEKKFEVARRQGVWVIPSHENYPADATENLQEAATMFINLDVLNEVSGDKDTHATYGVVEPGAESAADDSEAVGKLVTMKDGSGNRLVEVIIGKPVKDKSDQRYVRLPGQDQVYTVKLDPTRLSTEFGDWVVQDVLDLAAMDIQKMIIRDYSVSPVISQGRMFMALEDRSLIKVNWNADDFKWDLEELQEYVEGVGNEPGELRPTKLMDNEQLDKQRLDEMKNALAGLKIVDVSAKPDSLRRGLKSGEFDLENFEGRSSLEQRGFYGRSMPDGSLGIASTDGEVTSITKDGVDYTLRFGKIANPEGDASNINRYVMITASIDHDSIPQPELEDLPGEPVGPIADEPVEDLEDLEAGDRPDASSDGSANQAAVEGGEESEADEFDPERDRIAKENQRKLDEYNDKIAKAQKKVDELNLRFADWYYVISEEVYKDIHLSRMDVIEAKEATAEEGTGVEAFRKLMDEGLKRETTDQP